MKQICPSISDCVKTTIKEVMKVNMTLNGREVLCKTPDIIEVTTCSGACPSYDAYSFIIDGKPIGQPNVKMICITYLYYDIVVHRYPVTCHFS